MLNIIRYGEQSNNPLMYTDPSGKSFKDWWNRNIAEPFMREFQQVFGNGFTVSVGTNTQFSSWSLVGAFNGPNGMPYGPGFGVQTNNWKTFSPVYANYQGGFYNTQSVNFESNMQQAVAQAEQNARGEYFGQKVFESSYNWIVETYNVLFTDGYIYGESNQTQNNNNNEMMLSITGVVGDVSGFAEESKGIRFGSGKGISSVTNALGTYKAYMDIYNSHHSILNWTDAVTGTAGVSVSLLELAGYDIPYVGEGLMIYNGLRLYYDYYNLQNNPSPIWNRLPTYQPSNHVPTITNPYKP